LASGMCRGTDRCKSLDTTFATSRCPVAPLPSSPRCGGKGATSLQLRVPLILCACTDKTPEQEKNSDVRSDEKSMEDTALTEPSACIRTFNYYRIARHSASSLPTPSSISPERRHWHTLFGRRLQRRCSAGRLRPAAVVFAGCRSQVVGAAPPHRREKDTHKEGPHGSPRGFLESLQEQ